MKETLFQANLEEYKSDALNQTLSLPYALRNSVMLPSMLLKNPHKIKD